MRASLTDATQSAADRATISFADPAGRPQLLWSIDGCDLEWEGLAPRDAKTAGHLEYIPDVRAAYDRIDAAARWLGPAELLAADPRPYGVVARLSLKGFDRIDSMYFDPGHVLTGSEVPPTLPQDRTYLPGAYQQAVHAIVRCHARFHPYQADKPTLVRREFGSDQRQRLAFGNTSDLLLTCSHLCNHVDASTPPTRHVVRGEELVLEDAEFALYYELLAHPPAVEQRPVPYCRPVGAGGGGVPQCVPPAKLRL